MTKNTFHLHFGELALRLQQPHIERVLLHVKVPVHAPPPCNDPSHQQHNPYTQRDAERHGAGLAERRAVCC